MTKTPAQRSDEFLKASGQFRLGALVTESSHPVTADFSEVAKLDAAAALKLLFDVDADVIRTYRKFVESGRAGEIKESIARAVNGGGRIFFTGCGSTGRLSILLDSIWRNFWQQRGGVAATDFENRTVSVMAGGDFALIKAVEGFEDFTGFGKKQMTELGVSAKDVVFAITEGGETSFVIGTAWAGVEAGAKVYFVYNNPDEILCQHLQRSCEVIQDARIEKVNLTTGPMAVAGSTRMQATSIQLCVMLTVLEMVVRELINRSPDRPVSSTSPADPVPTTFLARLEAAHAALQSPEFLAALVQLAALEESTYRVGGKCSYFAGNLGIDVLADTAERSPTFGTPPFRKFDDDAAAESWSFLFLAEDWTDNAWQEILKRKPRCVEWSEAEIRDLVPEENVERTLETVRKISSTELMRYKIGSNGVRYRELVVADCAIAVMAAVEKESSRKFQLLQLEKAQASNAHTGLIYFGPELPAEISAAAEVVTFVPLPESGLLLDGVTRVVVKLVMNALSTCTMARLGRVLGNDMICVVPGNLKLIDRATRSITRHSGLTYEAANRLLFEVIAYVEPRLRADKAYPSVVAVAILRAREKLTNEQAEEKLKAGL